MATTALTPAASTYRSGLYAWLTTTDHKKIGIMYLINSFVFFFIGGLLVLAVRAELAQPGLQFVEDQFYNELFSMHATLMIFVFIIPILAGFANYVVPLQIGAPDMAFPRINALSFWMLPLGGGLLLLGFLTGGAAAAGWTSYPPLSEDRPLASVGSGQDLWIVGLVLIGTSSILGAINFLVTIFKMRAPGMTLFRMPILVWTVLVTSVLVLMATPVITSALIMLFIDRNYGGAFFDPANGGDAILYQNIFWFYSHPAVYIMILPGFGIISEVIAVFARKPVFGYRLMAMSLVAILILGFSVWAHHMFVAGMAPWLRIPMMITTLLIAVPTGIKVFSWLATLWEGRIQFKTPMLWAFGFISMFVIGGLSGIYMANTPVDIFIHDTYFIVAHIHYVVFGGSIFAIFGGVHYWFPKMFGRMMNDTLGKIHFWITLIAFNGTFFPMHILGVGGHMRRIANPLKYDFLKDLQHWNEFITISALILGFAQFIFWFNFVWSMFKGPKAEKNPWHANTLEWEAPTPPPHGNFEAIPTVYHGPYEYSVPGMKEDYLPQAMPAPAGAQVGGH